VDIRKVVEEIQAYEEIEEGIVVCFYSGKCWSIGAIKRMYSL
jgi:hypothetical protein